MSRMSFRLDQLSAAHRAQAEAQIKPKAKVVDPIIEKQQTHHKYRALPTEIDGKKFASRKEAARWMLLREMERRGEIQNLLLHGRIELIVNGLSICHFEPDFMFEKDGKLHAEDTKGMSNGIPWQMYLIKAKLFEALHGTRVLTV